MHTKRLTGKKAFTLIEMTVTIAVSLMVAAISLTLFNSQLASFKILKAQNFLVSEAPQVNNTLNRIVSRANFFRMYENMHDATSSQNAVISGGKVLALKFTGTDDITDRFGVIAFDEDHHKLAYYNISSMAELTVANPSWHISTSIHDASFFVENGVLRIKLTGPNGEEIIYSSSTQR